MPNARALAFVLLAMPFARSGFATELGLPTAGFHVQPVDLRVAFAVDSTQYSLTDVNDPSASYVGSFLQADAVASISIQQWVELNAHDGGGLFKGYDQPGGGPEGAYETFGGGVRATVWHSDENMVQVGGGLQFAWWRKRGTEEIAGGDHQELAGLSVHLPPGTVIYAGGFHYSVGSGLAVPVTISSTQADTRVTGDGYGIYGGVQFRLAFLSGRVEAKAEAPEFTNTGLGASLGLEF